MWTKFTAPSDLDYWEQGRRSGLERSCAGCGDPVLVDRAETYAIQVWCPACLELQQQKAERARQLAKGAA